MKSGERWCTHFFPKIHFVTRNTVKADIQAMSKECRVRIASLFKESASNLVKNSLMALIRGGLGAEAVGGGRLWIHLTADGKKVKGTPVFNVIVSFGSLEESALKRVVFPLEISKLEDKSAKGRATWILTAFRKAGVPTDWLVSLTADEGEVDVCKFLGEHVIFVQQKSKQTNYSTSTALRRFSHSKWQHNSTRDFFYFVPSTDFLLLIC